MKVFMTPTGLHCAHVLDNWIVLLFHYWIGLCSLFLAQTVGFVVWIVLLDQLDLLDYLIALCSLFLAQTVGSVIWIVLLNQLDYLNYVVALCLLFLAQTVGLVCWQFTRIILG